MIVSVLGAGYMGSAITYPLADNGTQVRLWGTWLDDEILAASRRGEHPRLKKALRAEVRLFSSVELEDCLRGADLVIIGVTSEGFLPVYTRLLENLAEPLPLYALTKGFVSFEGRICRLSEAAEVLYRRRFEGRPFLWASIGGPVKAAELARFIPTCSAHALGRPDLRRFIPCFATGYYRVLPCSDVAGVELCSALKNAYAIALGLCDGLYRDGPAHGYDNLKAFLLSDAAEEMARIVETAGGRRETALGLAGTGDLYVTAQSGRNRRFGELIGTGAEPARAYREMLAGQEVAEGYGALELGLRYVSQLEEGLADRLPLLRALHRIVFGGVDIRAELERYVRSRGPGSGT